MVVVMGGTCVEKGGYWLIVVVALPGHMAILMTHCVIYKRCVIPRVKARRHAWYVPIANPSRGVAQASGSTCGDNCLAQQLKSARSLWERGCPANTGGAGAIHRVGFFAGKPAPTGSRAGLRHMQYLWTLCLAQHLKAGAITVGAALAANTGGAGAIHRAGFRLMQYLMRLCKGRPACLPHPLAGTAGKHLKWQ